MSYNIKININNKPVCIQFNEKTKLGEGQYGYVYFLSQNNFDNDINNNKYVIKISKDEFDDFSFENYIYYKYHKSTEKIKCIPECIVSGKTINMITGKKHNYLILTYAGFLTFKNFISLLVVNKNCLFSEITNIIKIIYSTGLHFIKSLHNHNIICRDLKPENIIVSDYLLYYLMDKIGIDKLQKYIPSFILNIIKNINHVSYQNIYDFYTSQKYENIIQFIDVGLFCDINVLTHDQIYSKKNEKCYAEFYNFDPFDSLFATTMSFLSPFALFNFSSLINNFSNDDKKDFIHIIKTLMKLSDYWSFNIVFIYFFYSFIGDYYRDIIKIECFIKKFYENKKIYSYKFLDSLFFDVNIDAQMNKQIYLKEVICDKINKYNFRINDYVFDYINNVIKLTQYLLLFINKNNNTLPFCIDINSQKIKEIKNKLLSFANDFDYENIAVKIFNN
jgi:serine/threonine protein kinase